MATTVEQAILTSLRRARDPHGLALSSATVMDVLSRVQQLVNLWQGDVLATETLTLDPWRQVYPVSLLPRSGRVVAVRHEGRDLHRIEWLALRHVDAAWTRAVASRPEAWAPMGRLHLIVHPALPVAGTVEVISITQTAALTIGTSLEIPDERLALVYDAVEAILLIQRRLLDAAVDVRERVLTRIKAGRA